MSAITTAELTCPTCGFVQAAEMPREACQFFYECVSCASILRPQHGDCCVFCSYADTPCPSMQHDEAPHVYDQRAPKDGDQRDFDRSAREIVVAGAPSTFSN